MRALLAAFALAAPLAGGAAEADLGAARAAWRYFERNVHAATGLVSSVEGHPSTSAWDLGSSIIATLAAGELELADDGALDERLASLLRTLEAMPLFAGELPNKAYDARTATMTDYENRPAPAGIGFSALDLGRLVSALALLGDLRPETRDRVERVLARWKTCRLARGGELFGVHRDAAGRAVHAQEGRLGYEQYAAKALALIGLDTRLARSYHRFLAEAPLLGVAVPHDVRDRRRSGAVDALVTEPWVLDGFEFGLAGGGAPLARRVFDVQKRRYEETGIPTALSEDHVDRPPWFVYDAIVAGGVPWRTVGPTGEEIAGVRGLSTKAAFALAALFPDDPYAKVLRRAVERTRDAERGWFASVYERGGTNRALTANTNGVVLEALLFERLGPLHRACTQDCDSWRARLARLAARRGECPRLDSGSSPPRNAGLERVPDGGGSSQPRNGLERVPDAGSAGPGEAASRTLAPPMPDRGAAAAPAPRSRSGGLRVDGSFLATYRGAEGPGAGGIATVWPWRSAFLRLGAEATPISDLGGARLVWGFGWDDWRADTFSLTVNNWGPLRPEDAPGWRRAELNVGYKLPRLCSEWLCAAPVASVTVPFTGGPYGDVRVTFTFFQKWFVMGGLGRAIPGVFEGPPGAPQWRMVYGFGRWDWRPGTLFITYHDWGPDWRARNGVLALGVNWSF